MLRYVHQRPHRHVLCFYFPNAGNSVTLEGATDVMVNAGTCTQVQYACVSLAEGSGASYRDADSSDASNVACALVTDILTCFPGLLKHLDTNLHFMLLQSGLSGVKLGVQKDGQKHVCLFIYNATINVPKTATQFVGDMV